MRRFEMFKSLAGGAMALCAALAFAQTPPAKKPAATAAAAAPAAAPAAASADAPVKVTPETRAAIKDLLTTIKARDSLAAAYQGLAQSLPQQMAQMFSLAIQRDTQLSDENKKKVRDHLAQSFDATTKEGVAILQDPKLIDQIVENIYPIYAKYYTVDEIKQITAFYKTPVGAKSITIMPKVLNESMTSGMALVQPKLTALMEKTMKKELDAVQPK